MTKPFLAIEEVRFLSLLLWWWWWRRSLRKRIVHKSTNQSKSHVIYYERWWATSWFRAIIASCIHFLDHWQHGTLVRYNYIAFLVPTNPVVGRIAYGDRRSQQFKHLLVFTCLVVVRRHRCLVGWLFLGSTQMSKKTTTSQTRKLIR